MYSDRLSYVKAAIMKLKNGKRKEKKAGLGDVRVSSWYEDLRLTNIYIGI